MATDQLQGAGSLRSARPRTAPSGSRVVLHVGCGPADGQSLHQRFRGPEWREIRVDLDPNVEPDLVASITDLHPIAESSVDAVWSSHNLEHLSAHEVPVGVERVLSRPQAGRDRPDHASRPAAGGRIHRRRQAGRGCVRVGGRAHHAARLRFWSGKGHCRRPDAHGAPHGFYGDDPSQTPRTGRLWQRADFVLSLCTLGRRDQSAPRLAGRLPVRGKVPSFIEG